MANECGIVKYKNTNGEWVSIPTLKGDKGDPGSDGTSVSIASTKKTDEGVKVTFSDGTEILVPKGDKGDKGDNGSSITVTTSSKDDKGNTVVTFSDGTSVTIDKGSDGTTLEKVQDFTKKLEVYELSQTSNVRNQDGKEKVDPSRMTLTYNRATGLGILHLDYQQLVAGSPKGFVLPANSPTPIAFIEYREGNSTAYIFKGSRNVMLQGSDLKKRIIINLIGYFE